MMAMHHRMPRPWYPMKWRPQFSPELGPFGWFNARRE
jgi:hypothetical protein